MALEFPSDAWVKALGEGLNASNGYRAAAKKWEGDLIFVVEKGGVLSDDAYLYLDLWHGDCRDAYALADAGAKSSEFTLSAPLATWQQVITGQLDPIKAIMTKKLGLKGPMTKILKSPRAALELVKCAGELDTNWPS
jgi:putative sterol carrier protein